VLKSRAQADTVSVTVEKVMVSPYFELGATDRRAGRGYPDKYETWDGNDQWSYERGRMWAVLAPRSVKLRLGGKLNPQAFMYLDGII
jgi:hypothetical protein